MDHRHSNEVPLIDGTIDHLTSEYLGLIIMPTEKCNFRCAYCFEDFKIRKMTTEVTEGVKNLIRNRANDLKVLEVSWFGGEPLLAPDIIKEIMLTIKEEQKKPDNKNLTLIGEMVTNGFLLKPELLKTLVELGITYYQISFDGDKESHDKLRVLADGRPTFDEIWTNMVEAHKTDMQFDIQIRIHANELNSESTKQFMQRIAVELGGDIRFRLFIRPLSKMGGKNDLILPILKRDDTVDESKSFARTLGLRLREQENDNNYVCFASKLNSFVVRANGNISKCEVALYDDKNIVGRINQDGTLSLDNNKLAWWSRGLFNGDKDALACPMKGKTKVHS